MERRSFLRTLRSTFAGATAYLLASRNTKARATAGVGVRVNEPAPAGSVNDNYRFKLGMYLPELQLPFDQALAKAKEIGVESVWFNRLHQEAEIAQLSDAEADRMAQRVQRHGLEIFLLSAGSSFKHIHLTELDKDKPTANDLFQKDLAELVRCMEIASRIGVGAVGAFTFAWPGEYSAGKPTWGMRWLTRGGYIAEVDMKKWVAAFSLVAEEAEKHKVDVALSMMPWNYTNTTGNFRRLVEAVGSRRLKVMWGPADNFNSGEWDVSTAGFYNVRPHLHGLHLKDLHVSDGLRLKFEYRPLGTGDVDYPGVLRNLRAHGSDAVLSLSTHFTPAGGTKEDAMRTNYANLQRLIREVESEARDKRRVEGGERA